MSSFQKRRTTPLLPGGKQSLHTGQQLVSTGNPALDHILGEYRSSDKIQMKSLQCSDVILQAVVCRLVQLY